MASSIPTVSVSKNQLWAGRILSALPILFLLMDGGMKLAKPKFVVDATVQLGYAESVVVGLGIVLTICTILYAIPRTSVLGAILLTGYLGGAVATHVRLGNPWFSHILFPVYLGILIWGGLYLRDARLRSLISSIAQITSESKKMIWAGRILSALPVLLLLFSGFMKVTKRPEVIEGFAKFGYQERVIVGIGVLEIACTILYLIPRTSVLGAILVAGYMGGAAATHLRLGEPVILQVLLGVLAWGGLYLRDARLRALIPVKS